MDRFCRATPLTRAAEVDLLGQLERAELEIARTLLGSEAAVAEYGAVFTALRAQRLRVTDVTRQSPVGNLHEEHCRVCTAFEVVDELGRARSAGLSGRSVERARRRADLALGVLRPSRALLERVASALRAQCEVASDGESTLLAFAKRADIRETLAAMASSERQARRLRSQLVEANQGLVMSIAKRARCEGLELSDLVQEGNVGLMQAVDRFDCERGYRFGTYATFWIRQSISAARANKARTIRLPTHVLRAGRALGRARRAIEQQCARAATVGEMAAATGLSVGAVASALRAIEEPRSLDAPGEGMALHDALEDPDAVHPLEAIASRELANAGGTLLKHLTPREQLVLRMRFGFAGRRPRTLTEIGQRFSLTRERIRQIESGALQKLRETPLVSHLRGHLEP